MSFDEGETSKNLLVIGGSSGIARSVIRKASDAGWNVFASSRAQSEAQSGLKSLPDEELHLGKLEWDQSTGVEALNLDLESEYSIRSFVSTLSRNGIKFDGLVFAGATSHGGRIGLVSSEEVERILRINLFSAISLSQRLVRLLRPPASVVLISSDSAHTAITGNFLYGTSKAALERFSKSLALEVANRGVRVNCVSPTLVDTPMLKQMDDKSRTEVLALARAERVLRPDEVASTILFLLSDSSSAINGQSLYLGEYAS
ncbi:SDR family oxidoreductase [Aquiluna sp.]|nr:SDR family oxidoreductase [Aquiluna sp.]